MVDRLSICTPRRDVSRCFLLPFPVRFLVLPRSEQNIVILLFSFLQNYLIQYGSGNGHHCTIQFHDYKAIMLDTSVYFPAITFLKSASVVRGCVCYYVDYCLVLFVQRYVYLSKNTNFIFSVLHWVLIQVYNTLHCQRQEIEWML